MVKASMWLIVETSDRQLTSWVQDYCIIGSYLSSLTPSWTYHYRNPQGKKKRKKSSGLRSNFLKGERIQTDAENSGLGSSKQGAGGGSLQFCIPGRTWQNLKLKARKKFVPLFWRWVKFVSRFLPPKPPCRESTCILCPSPSPRVNDKYCSSTW